MENNTDKICLKKTNKQKKKNEKILKKSFLQ